MKDKKHIDSKGFTVGELLLVFVIVLAIGALLAPLIRFNQIRMDKIICANNLREAGLALYIYAREHDGKFPQDMQTLYDQQYLADEKLMDCPGSKTIGTPADPDYVYTPELSVRSNSMDALLRDKDTNHHSGSRNVLYVNGLVAWEEIES